MLELYDSIIHSNEIFSMFKAQQAEVNLYIQIRENDFMKSSTDVLLNQHIMHSVSVWSLQDMPATCNFI